jgi:hypothetical protein
MWPGHSTTLSGHAFIIIGLKTSHGVKEEIFGFYPTKDSLKGMIKGPGMLKGEERCGPEDECGPKHEDELRKRLSEVTDSVTIPITLGDVKKIYSVIKQWDSSSYPDSVANKQVVPRSDGDYKLFDRNCIDFIANVATELGYPVPDRGKLQLPVDFISEFKPLAEAEEKTRAARRDAETAKKDAETAKQNAEMEKQKAAEADERAKQSDLAKQKAERDTAKAIEQKRQSDLARQQAEQRAAAAQQQLNQSVPPGWIVCNCHNAHANMGKVINGVRYHAQGFDCP